MPSEGHGMRRAFLAAVMLLLAVAAGAEVTPVAPTGTLIEPPHAPHAFEAMRALVGHWIVEDADNIAGVHYSLVARGASLEERSRAYVAMYRPDYDSILMDLYTAIGVQHLRCGGTGMQPGHLIFVSTDVANLSALNYPAPGPVKSLELDFNPPPDRVLHQHWTYWRDNRDQVQSYRLRLRRP